MNPTKVDIVQLEREAYQPVFTRMRDVTDQRDQSSPDQLWVVEHDPVFTQGQAGKPEHLINTGDIPVVQSDRGGQVTYHGPGQVVIYLLLDIRRRKLGIRPLVNIIEGSIIDYLATLGVDAKARPEAPGVYVGDAKIAALGLRVRRGCSYHGLSLNVDPDLSVFDRINPCGYQGMPVTSLNKLGLDVSWQSAADALCQQLSSRLNS